MTLDRTHDPRRRSWVASANGHPDFPIQNLPHGIFSDGGAPRGGVAIGDFVLDLSAAIDAGVLRGDAAEAAAGPTLNAFFAQSPEARAALRAQIGDLLDAGAPARPGLLRGAHLCAMRLPAAVGDYTDFYVGVHHATNVGRVFRPDNPLLPNYKHVPIGYHGRASTIGVSGETVRRPHGQRKPAGQDAPDFGPCRALDFELELGVWIGPGVARGAPAPIADAHRHIAGLCLLNDWSARDVQAWEYQPLGPFLAKSFATTVSPWVVTMDALAPFRIPQPPRDAEDPAPLPYLTDAADQAAGAFDIELEVFIETPAMRGAGLAPHRLSLSSSRHMYWTVAQLVAHHTCGGCDLRPGDLFGTGTISTPDDSGLGSLMEMSRGGTTPLTLPSGETRTYLEDGDAIVFRAAAKRDRFARIGFGECRATIAGAA